MKTKDKKRARLIYNPFSGNGTILTNLDEVFSTYQKYGYILEVFRISFEIELEEILYDIEKLDHLLISGGDGTINQVVNILKKNNIEIPIGILPYGTANDFATLLDIPKDPREACEKILNSNGVDIDIGVLNGEYFLNVASAGIFSEASNNINPTLKKLGRVGYYLNGVKDAAKLKKVKVKIQWDKGVIVEDILAILVFNGKSVGLINLARNSSLEDGEFDVLVINPRNIIEIVEILGKVVTNEELTEKLKGLHYFRTSKLYVEHYKGISPSTDIDGEKGPDFPLEINCIKKGIRILGYK